MEAIKTLALHITWEIIFPLQNAVCIIKSSKNNNKQPLPNIAHSEAIVVCDAPAKAWERFHQLQHRELLEGLIFMSV
jgi:hypothetical protein